MKVMSFINNFSVYVFLGAALLAMQTAVMASEITHERQNELTYLLQHDCGSCHGMTLKGGLGPALLPETLSAQSREYLVRTILEGRENTAMPPWKNMLSYSDALWIAEQLQNGHIGQNRLAEGAR